MATRSRSHVLEEISRRAFENIIPPEWLVRTQFPDYGLDIQVQIFSDEKATPYYFYVQLKATDTIREEGSLPSFRFKTERLIQYIECIEFPQNTNHQLVISPNITVNRAG